MEKYIAYLDGMQDRSESSNETPVIAMKYDFTKKLFTIGGYRHFRRAIQIVLTRYFEVSEEKLASAAVRFTQKNKIRYNFVLTDKIVYGGWEAMEKDGIVLKSVKKHERIMR